MKGHSVKTLDIAIVGISVFCPAGDGVDEVWDGIARGGDFITDAPNDVINSFYFDGVPNGVDSFYCKRGGFCKPFKIDPIRYGIMPITANGTEPDQLISMATAEQALIDAGIFEKKISLQNCSVIIGKGNFSGIVALRSLEIIRMAHQVRSILKAALPDLTDGDLDKFKKAYQDRQGYYKPDMATGTMPNLVASLVANRFDMQGPAYTLDAACASGIVAINHSINLLRTGQCDVALAGAMHPTHSAMFWSAFDMLGAMSHKQVIAPFSEDADGLLVGQGGGFLVLKTLNKAIEDGDRVYAVIKETAICSDGASSHVMVTSVSGQTRVLEQAWKKAGMDPGRIGYVEAHGTGTKVGDKTELMTLKSFFGDSSKPRAYLGSIKSNIGHAMPAAGMLGVIKTALSLYWRKIPPTLHCERPLAAMRESRFEPPGGLIDWDGEQLPLVAGVNAFGFGGINAHAILTAYEAAAYEPGAGAIKQLHKHYYGEAIMLSATSGPELVGKLKKGDFSDSGGDYRIVVFDPDDARIAQAAAVVERDRPWHGRADIWFSNSPMLSRGGKIVFMYPSFNLEWDPEIDKLGDALGLQPISSLISQYDNGKESTLRILRTHYTKWLCMDALGILGVEGDMYVGHSIGEWDATVFAGISDVDMDEWKENLANIWEFTKNYPTLAVSGLSRAEAEGMCAGIPDVWVAGDNCPSQVLIIGEEPSIDILKGRLADGNVFFTVMPFGIGWHTPLAEDELGAHREFIKGVRIREGRVPVWSAHTLEPIPANKEDYDRLQSAQLTSPVRFRELIEKLYGEQGARVFIQIGYGSLSGFVDDILKGKEFASVPTNNAIRNTADQLRRVLAMLYVEGRQVDSAFMGVKPGNRVTNSLLTLPRGAPPLLQDLPGLGDAAAANSRAFDILDGAGGELTSGSLTAKGQSLEGQSIIEAALTGNIREAVAVQRELTQLYKIRVQFPNALGKVKLANTPMQADALGGAKAAGGVATSARGGAMPAGATVQASTQASGIPAQTGAFEEAIKLDIESHPYLVDHSIVRQPEGWPITEDLNPVVPFTMTIELLAGIAKKRAPGRKLQRICKIAAFKWIELQKPFEATVRGKWANKDTLELELGDNAKAAFVFGDAPLVPPAYYAGGAGMDIGHEIMAPIPSAYLYNKYSFHGPQYQSGIYQKQICSKGLEVTCKKQRGMGSLLDIMGQQLGLFLHLTQTENTISFPVRLKELAFYSDIDNQDGDFTQTMLITQMTKNIVTGDMVIMRGDQVWCVAKEFICQRFENFVPIWNVILLPRSHKLADEVAPGVYYYKGNSKGNVVALLAKRYLSSPDMEHLFTLKTQMQKWEYVVSQIALKDAVRSHIADDQRELPYPIELYCGRGESGAPCLKGYGGIEKLVGGLFFSVSSRENSAAAVTSDKPVGIGIEKVEAPPDGFIGTVFTENEIKMLEGENNSPEAIARFLAAKTAYINKSGERLEGDGGLNRYEISMANGSELAINGTHLNAIKHEDGIVICWTTD